ncbi:thermonuclease family protein [Bradyrhizobium guangdongense]|uniref:thermonuclease family protein n=1 Tax=Bradyrhizobium guangdongense TaxID=1325090 RepID=UPI001FDA750B|nr:thermonuclease family protein [Bradyrhizobium guangdongense]
MTRCIEVTVAGERVDINHWLVEQGFAYPTFYPSMSEDEIRAFLALAKTARTRKLPVWKHLARTIPAFEERRSSFSLRGSCLGKRRRPW